MIITALIFMEVFSMCMAVFMLYARRGNTFAESASYAVITVFMLLSFVHQVSFISGFPMIAAGMDALYFIASFILIFRYRSTVLNIFHILKNFGSQNPMVSFFLMVCFSFMVVHIFLPVSKEFQNEFYTMNSYLKEGLSLHASGSGFPAFLSLNHLILFNLSLSTGINPGAGIFCFSAYLSIGFSTYALARRYAWQSTAFTTAILVMSMPGLIDQAIVSSGEIISAAVGLFCILAIYRTIERPNLTDLILLILGLFFCISENIATLIFVPILFVLSLVVLFRRHGVITWKSILTNHPYSFLFVIPAVIFSQTWLFAWNHFHTGTWSDTFTSIPYNKDGIQGALGNFVRYLFESLYLTLPPGKFFERIFNWSMIHSLQSLYDSAIRPFLGESGAVRVYHLVRMPNDMFSFGPVGFFLVLPALCYAILKGPRRLKAVATALIAYFYLISLIFAWTPGNARFLEIFYVCSGFTIAFFFPPWRFTKRNKKILQISSCLLMLLTLLAAL